MAIMKKADMENGYLGFTCHYCGDDKDEFYYFDRYPVIFSGVMNVLLRPFEQNVKLEVAVARGVMSLIFLVTMIFSFKLIRTFTENDIQAFSSVLLTFSGTFFIWYQDMVHYDQPAILGIVILMYHIRKYQLEGNSKHLLLLCAVIPLVGRGYASLFLLAIWVVVEFFGLVRERSLNVGGLLKLKSLQGLTLAVLFCVIFLGYNIYQESLIRDVSIQETSIVKSALVRTGVTDLSVKYQSIYDWSGFSVNQLKRFCAGFLPYGLYQVSDKGPSIIPSLLGIIYFLGISIAMLLALIRRDLRQWLYNHRSSLLVMLLSGPFWLFFMKNLAGPHNYTTMYYVLIYLVAHVLLVRFVPSKGQVILFLFAFLMFNYSLIKKSEMVSERVKSQEIFHSDFDRMRQLLSEEKGGVIWVKNGITKEFPGIPYAICYYLFDNQISEESGCDGFCLTTEKQVPGYHLVTPENSKLFLHERIN